jgi:hypothetical protein
MDPMHRRAERRYRLDGQSDWCGRQRATRPPPKGRRLIGHARRAEIFLLDNGRPRVALATRSISWGRADNSEHRDEYVLTAPPTPAHLAISYMESRICRPTHARGWRDSESRTWSRPDCGDGVVVRDFPCGDNDLAAP